MFNYNEKNHFSRNLQKDMNMKNILPYFILLISIMLMQCNSLSSNKPGSDMDSITVEPLYSNVDDVTLFIEDVDVKKALEIKEEKKSLFFHKLNVLYEKNMKALREIQEETKRTGPALVEPLHIPYGVKIVLYEKGEEKAGFYLMFKTHIYGSSIGRSFDSKEYWTPKSLRTIQRVLKNDDNNAELDRWNGKYPPEDIFDTGNACE